MYNTHRRRVDAIIKRVTAIYVFQNVVDMTSYSTVYIWLYIVSGLSIV